MVAIQKNTGVVFIYHRQLKSRFSIEKVLIFESLLISTTTYVMALRMSTHNICFRREIRNYYIFVDTFLSVVMDRVSNETNITKTCLYNFDPLKPHFYIVKLGFTGVYIIFLISAQKRILCVLVRTAS